MSAVVRAWDRFWFAPIHPLPAALFRISVGALIFLMYVALHPNWEIYYAPNGILSLGDPAPGGPWREGWSVFRLTDGVLPIRLWYWLGLAAAATFTIGWWTRPSALVLWILQCSLVHRSPAVVNGEDLVVRMLLFYSCFAPLGAALSVDAARRPMAWTPQIWAIRLIQINVCLVYVFTQSHKVFGDVVWRNGDAMYYTMVSRIWSRWPWPALYYDGVVSTLSTYASLLLEIGFPIAVWFSRVRVWAVLAITGLHLAIALALSNVGFFSLSMACSFWAFLTTDDLRRLRPQPGMCTSSSLIPSGSAKKTA